jgi:hypothetical protein
VFKSVVIKFESEVLLRKDDEFHVQRRTFRQKRDEVTGR